jgi:hypothetical protein
MQINARTAGRPALTHHPHPNHPMWDVHFRCQPDARSMPPGWVLPFPLFILLLRPLAVAGRLLTAAGRLLTAAGRQPSDSAGSKVREITGRRL